MTDVKKTFRGYDEDVLDEIFEAIGGDPKDPWASLVALVPENMLDVVRAAIEWYTCFPPIVIPEKDGHYLVISEGYSEGGLMIISKKGKKEIDHES
jgi:hypothetical protein